MKVDKNYAGYEYSGKSIDAYVKLSGGTKIQFRSFGTGLGLTGFQGEVKGANANQGKIGLEAYKHDIESSWIFSNSNERNK